MSNNKTNGCKTSSTSTRKIRAKIISNGHGHGHSHSHNIRNMESITLVQLHISKPSLCNTTDNLPGNGNDNDDDLDSYNTTATIRLFASCLLAIDQNHSQTVRVIIIVSTLILIRTFLISILPVTPSRHITTQSRTHCRPIFTVYGLYHKLVVLPSNYDKHRALQALLIHPRSSNRPGVATADLSHCG